MYVRTSRTAPGVWWGKNVIMNLDSKSMRTYTWECMYIPDRKVFPDSVWIFESLKSSSRTECILSKDNAEQLRSFGTEIKLNFLILMELYCIREPTCSKTLLVGWKVPNSNWFLFISVPPRRERERKNCRRKGWKYARISYLEIKDFAA